MPKTIIIKASELWDPVNQCFIELNKDHKIVIEHSLVSISKWESEWKRPFLDRKKRMTTEESISYIKHMTLTQNVDPLVYKCITNQNIDEVAAYINDSMTATWFREEKGGFNRRIITSELIYYWMIALNIPMECQKWHLNRLLTLIRVCNEENKPKKKGKLNEIYASNRALNEQRKAQLGTKG